jgi:hypothetical protein
MPEEMSFRIGHITSVYGRTVRTRLGEGYPLGGI